MFYNVFIFVVFDSKTTIASINLVVCGLSFIRIVVNMIVFFFVQILFHIYVTFFVLYFPSFYLTKSEPWYFDIIYIFRPDFLDESQLQSRHNVE